ncbi:MAG: nucleotidyltransferase family protein, partial [Candidatus Brocadia sp.]
KTIESLKAYFKDKHVGKVILVGSVLEEGKFYPFSDIDVVVDGLEEDYLKTLAELEEILERDVDLIEMRKCKFKDSLLRKGMKIV